MTRYYRGTTSGLYSSYADVPIIAPDPAGVVDDGHYIGGVKWKNRSPSGIDQIYSPDISVPWHIYGLYILKNMVPIITVPSNTSVTLSVASDQQVTYLSALTAGRSVTLPALGRTGDRVRVTRTSGATGAFNVTIAYGAGGSSTATLAAPINVAFADFEYNGTYWALMAKSTN